MVSGAALNAGFYRDVVWPLLGGVAHSAGLLGWGSDVLGYDTGRSTDHGWGPAAALQHPSNFRRTGALYADAGGR